MKSILLGGEKIFNVYDERTLAALRSEAGLCDTHFSKDDIISNPEKFKNTEYIFSTWGMPSFSKQEIHDYLPSLKAVMYGAGTVKGFAAPFLSSGVRIFSAWGANAVPVAEFTVAQIILANKGFFLSCRRHSSLKGRENGANYASRTPGNFNTKIGIIGAGMIGKLVIEYLRPYKLDVLVFDPFLSDEAAENLGVKKASLERIFSDCQVISNHLANVPATVGMLNYTHFSLMNDTATFINTGRGTQVVEDDLIRALCEVPERTAILDVTDPEPPLADSPFYSMENVFLSPHIAGSAGNEVARMGHYMLEEYRKLVAGEVCKYEVTEKMLATMA
jgi:phosphoglycerate dehydrogenase-like enzyme